MSRKAAIEAMCKQCIYDDHSPGTWREQVLACTSPACPLYCYRPVPRTAKTVEKISQKRVIQLEQARDKKAAI